MRKSGWPSVPAVRSIEPPDSGFLSQYLRSQSQSERVQDLCFKVQGAGLRVQDSKCKP